MDDEPKSKHVLEFFKHCEEQEYETPLETVIYNAEMMRDMIFGATSVIAKNIVAMDRDIQRVKSVISRYSVDCPEKRHATHMLQKLMAERYVAFSKCSITLREIKVLCDNLNTKVRHFIPTEKTVGLIIDCETLWRESYELQMAKSTSEHRPGDM